MKGQSSQQHRNKHGQPIGPDVPNWRRCDNPPRTAMVGRTCSVVPLSMDHAADLYAAYNTDSTGSLWAYLPVGAFETMGDFEVFVQGACTSLDPLFFAIVDLSTERAIGISSFLRMQPEHGVCEVGFLIFSPALQRNTMSTEAMYLMMKRAFGLGYRRYEWKCDALNAASQAAARRLGFVYEGTFRQAIIYKQRSRDTAWFSIIDKDWPRIDKALQTWLLPENFDGEGQQRQSLSVYMQSS